MRKWSIILFVLITCLFCSSCGSTQSDEREPETEVTKIYLMETEEVDGRFAPYLQLNTATKSFFFSYSILSSYLPHGQYDIADGILTAKTEDRKYIYVFDVVDENTLKFITDSSSEVEPIDEKIDVRIEDGACFIQKETAKADYNSNEK